jgi:hypothetical protein
VTLSARRAAEARSFTYRVRHLYSYLNCSLSPFHKCVNGHSDTTVAEASLRRTNNRGRRSVLPRMHPRTAQTPSREGNLLLAFATPADLRQAALVIQVRLTTAQRRHRLAARDADRARPSGTRAGCLRLLSDHPRRVCSCKRLICAMGISPPCLTVERCEPWNCRRQECWSQVRKLNHRRRA